MLINLVPDFLAVLADDDREAAWQRYFESHSAVLNAYWRNYVLEPGTPAADVVVRNALAADRSDLHSLLAGVDIVRVVEETLARAEDVLRARGSGVDWWMIVVAALGLPAVASPRRAGQLAVAAVRAARKRDWFGVAKAGHAYLGAHSGDALTRAARP